MTSTFTPRASASAWETVIERTVITPGQTVVGYGDTPGPRRWSSVSTLMTAIALAVIPPPVVAMRRTLSSGEGFVSEPITFEWNRGETDWVWTEDLVSEGELDALLSLVRLPPGAESFRLSFPEF